MGGGPGWRSADGERGISGGHEVTQRVHSGWDWSGSGWRSQEDRRRAVALVVWTAASSGVG
eukprot:4820040-Lingulodinium_polyedra.AAC.1